MPISKFPEVLVSYGEMYIDIDVRYRAIKELLSELDSHDRIKLMKVAPKYHMNIKLKEDLIINDKPDFDYPKVKRSSTDIYERLLLG